MNDPLNTLSFFREITQIPRESGNEKQISDYLLEFAKKRNLFCRRDKFNNVLIKKKTADKEPLILQAHTDMVCEKEKSKEFDFAKDPIEIVEHDTYWSANGTTLGADNGIGVAQILAILDSDIPCNIEAVFTVSEETTMVGAMNFDTSDLSAKALLSLDSFEENTVILESACFYDISLEPKYNLTLPQNKNAYQISLTGMLGGHSGFDINKNRGNSSVMLAKLLSHIDGIELVDFFGGNKFNVIPSWAEAEFFTDLEEDDVESICETATKIFSKTYNGLKVTCSKIDEEKTKNLTEVLNPDNTKAFLKSILNFPHGIHFENDAHEVTTSVNLGGVSLSDRQFKVGMRSSRKSEEQECLQNLKSFCRKNHLRFKILGYQPGFESKKESDFIQKLIKSHPAELFEQPPVLESVHITLETGIFQSKIPGLQIALIAPNIFGPHTTHESFELESLAKTDNWLVNLVTNF